MEEISKKLEKIGIHGILAYSYSVYFIAMIIGIILHYSLQNDYFGNNESRVWGLWLLIAATVLIFWAQKTSAGTHKVREENKDKNITHHFKKGPYIFSRSPTHIGLFLALIGFGQMINSLFMIALAVIAYLVSHSSFVNKQEILLEKKYSESYKDYKKSVKL